MEVSLEVTWLLCSLHRIGQMESSSLTTVGPVKVEDKVCSICLHQRMDFSSSSMGDHVTAVWVKACLAYRQQTPSSFSARVDLVPARNKAC